MFLRKRKQKCEGIINSENMSDGSKSVVTSVMGSLESKTDKAIIPVIDNMKRDLENKKKEKSDNSQIMQLLINQQTQMMYQQVQLNQ